MGELAADAAPLAAASAGSLDGLRVTLLTASASRLGGGVATALQCHAALLHEAGAQVTVVALADRHSEEDRAALGPVPLRTAPVTGPAFFGYAPDLVRQLLATEADLLHLHGIWMYPSRAATLWARRTGRPYVVSTHGMLDPWITGRGRRKKALARAGYERASWRRADAIHALTEDEAADVRREAGQCRVVTIPNAGPSALAMAPGDRAPCVLYIGRIHPKKNLAALLDGWARADLPAGARLTIAGWGDPADVGRWGPVSENPDREELAVERTHFAEDRTIMAMERTFAGWMRTAFAAIGIGLAFHVVFGAFEPPWLARAIATLFILAGAWLAIAAERRACRTFDRLHAHQLSEPPKPMLRWLGWAVAVGAVLLVAGLWGLNDGELSPG